VIHARADLGIPERGFSTPYLLTPLHGWQAPTGTSLYIGLPGCVSKKKSSDLTFKSPFSASLTLEKSL